VSFTDLKLKHSSLASLASNISHFYIGNKEVHLKGA